MDNLPQLTAIGVLICVLILGYGAIDNWRKDTSNAYREADYQRLRADNGALQVAYNTLVESCRAWQIRAERAEELLLQIAGVRARDSISITNTIADIGKGARDISVGKDIDQEVKR